MIHAAMGKHYLSIHQSKAHIKSPANYEIVANQMVYVMKEKRQNKIITKQNKCFNDVNVNPNPSLTK